MTTTDAGKFMSRFAGGPGGGGGAGGGGRGRGGGGFGAAPREPLGKLFDRTPPAAPEAEASLLGSILLEPKVLNDVVQLIKGAEAFADAKHGLIYQAIVDHHEKHHALDVVQLSQLLADRGQLETIGGNEYLVSLASAVPAPNHAPHFARLVAQKHKLRRLIDAAGQILYDTYHAGQAIGEDVEQLVDRAESMVFEIAQEQDHEDSVEFRVLLDREWERLDAMAEGKFVHQGVRCGFTDLDETLGGFQPGEMIILAARPSMGKTALALNLAEQMMLGTSEPRAVRAVRPPVPVGIFSLEMSKQSLARRLLSAWSGVSAHHITSGRLGKHDFEALGTACQRLAEAPLYIDDQPGLSVLQLRARARRMVHQHGVKVIMIDYLQLLSAPAAARESRQVEVSAISRGLKSLARELSVPIVALAQLNRGPEATTDNRPKLSHLRESGSLEQDADVVALLHREEYYHKGDQEWLDAHQDKVGLAELIIAKQRNGPTGIVKLTWDAETTRFKNHSESGYGGGGYGGGGGGGGSGGGLSASFESRGGTAGTGGVGARAGGGFGGGGFGQGSGNASGGGTAAGGGRVPGFRAPLGADSGGGGAVSSGGWHAGRQSGPVANHRDGGGPDRDELRDAISGGPAPGEDAAGGRGGTDSDDGSGDGEEPAPF